MLRASPLIKFGETSRRGLNLIGWILEQSLIIVYHLLGFIIEETSDKIKLKVSYSNYIKQGKLLCTFTKGILKVFQTETIKYYSILNNINICVRIQHCSCLNCLTLQYRQQSKEV